MQGRPMVTPLDHAIYDDAETLERLLRKAGSRYALADLRDLIAGIEAAPEPLDPDAWMALVAADPGEPLKAQLRAFRTRLHSAHKGGASREEIAARVAALRAELARRGLD